jgi:hypothetical protein
MSRRTRSPDTAVSTATGDQGRVRSARTRTRRCGSCGRRAGTHAAGTTAGPNGGSGTSSTHGETQPRDDEGHDDARHGHPGRRRGPAQRDPQDVDRRLHDARAGLHLPHRSLVGAGARLPRARAVPRPRRDGRELRRRRHHWLLGRVDPGSVVLDLGCGAGTDLLIAAQMTGPTGTGHRRRHDRLDARPGPGQRRRDAAQQRRAARGAHRSRPDRGRLGRRRDLQRRHRPRPRRTRCSTRSIASFGRAAACSSLMSSSTARSQRTRASASTSGRAESPARCSRASTRDITQGELVATYARSAFEDTRRKAAKFGAMGSTIRATKPSS